MRNWILGGALAAASVSGVVLVLAGNGKQGHCGPCVGKPAASVVAVVTDETVACPRCKPTEVVDVADLQTGYETQTVPFVSFDEPPLARPRGGELVPTRFEKPAAADREVLPPPDEVK